MLAFILSCLCVCIAAFSTVILVSTLMLVAALDHLRLEIRARR